MEAKSLIIPIFLFSFSLAIAQSEDTKQKTRKEKIERRDDKKKAKENYKSYRKQTRASINWKTKRGEQLGYITPKKISLNKDLHIADTVCPFDELFILTLKVDKDSSPIKSVLLFSADVPYRRYHERRALSDNELVLEEYFEIRNSDKILKKKEDRVLYESLQTLFPRVVKEEFEPAIGIGEDDAKNKIYYFVVNPLAYDSRYRVEVKYESGTSTESFFISTITQSQKNRVARSLSGEFGVLTTGLPKSYALTYTASISLIPVNKDIPIKHYSLVSPQRMSVDFGVTINSLAEDGLVSDLIGTSNLFLGAGYKINDGVRLSTGYLFYERVSSNPFSEATSTDATPYVGITIDANVKSLIAGVLGAVGIK